MRRRDQDHRRIIMGVGTERETEAAGGRGGGGGGGGGGERVG